MDIMKMTAARCLMCYIDYCEGGVGRAGFMLFFVLPNRRMDVIRTLNNFEGQVSTVTLPRMALRHGGFNERLYFYSDC